MATAPISDQKTASNSSSLDSALSTLATQGKDGFDIVVGVEGMHCARCIAAIESTLKEEEQVTNARVNFSTQRLSLNWTGDREEGDRLLEKVRALGFRVKAMGGQPSKEAKSETQSLLIAMAIAGFAMGNIMLLSIGVWSMTSPDNEIATRELFHWISALIALPTIAWSGRIFFKSAIGALKKGRTNMDVPISIALILASTMSLWEAYNHGEHVYFDGAVMLTFFLLVGRYLDARARGQARRSAADLLEGLSGVARLVEGVSTRNIPVRELVGGMVVRVLPGDRIPADGKVLLGTSDVDASLITGESLPVTVNKDAKVYTGTLNMSGLLDIEVEKAGNDSLLAEIIRLMEVAEQASSRYVRIADRAAALYTPVVHTLGLASFLLWWLVLGATWQASLITAISVLIITCPCALGLAVPVVQVLATSYLMRRGVLIKNGDALEKLSVIKQIVFDKTGTLTLGQPKLLKGEWTETDLALAAKLASASRHPLCQAINDRVKDSETATDVQELPGLGLVANIDGQEVRLGSAKHVGLSADKAGQTMEVWLRTGEQKPVQFAFSDQLRDDAAQTITKLHNMGIKTSLLSGDRNEVAQEIGKTAGIQQVEAELTPAGKVERIHEKQSANGEAMMVGDGLNDAPSLAAAHVSMSPSSAVDISQQTAGIVFQGEHLSPVLKALLTSRASMKLVRQNFGLAILYNLIAIPVAVAGYASPLVAAIAMSSSSVIVVLNAFRLSGMVKGAEKKL